MPQRGFFVFVCMGVALFLLLFFSVSFATYGAPSWTFWFVSSVRVAHWLLACKVSPEKSVDSLKKDCVNVKKSLSLSSFKILVV